MNLEKTYRAVRNNRVSGRAADTAPEPGHPTITPACPRKGCKRALGHHRGVHGYAQGTGVRIKPDRRG